MLNKIIYLFKGILFMTTSYSINVFPSPLSKKDEEKYIDLALKGDKNARNKLIEHNLRLVAHIVKKFDSFNEDADDLISIGTIGLIKGIDSYNPNKAVRITTYAARCIENEILMYFRANKKNANIVSLNNSIGFDKDGNEITLADVIKEDTVEANDILYLKDNLESLKEYISCLNKREKDVIIKRYGLLGVKEQTQKEIALNLNISRSYVSRIEKRALVKMLREFIKNNKI